METIKKLAAKIYGRLSFSGTTATRETILSAVLTVAVMFSTQSLGVAMGKAAVVFNGLEPALQSMEEIEKTYIPARGTVAGEDAGDKSKPINERNQTPRTAMAIQFSNTWLEPVVQTVYYQQLPVTEAERSYIWPAHGTVTSGFGLRTVAVGSSDHRGLDIGGWRGQNIYAAKSGEVVFAGRNGGFGKMIRLQHENGDETLYAHCDKLLVTVGEWVYQGQVIAKMGTTGVSTGVHLHFEIIIDGVQVDPILFLP